MGVWALVIAGAITFWRLRPLPVKFTIVCIVVGVVLASTPLIHWASQFLPLVAGYREPHKFAALVALGYAVLAAFGAVAIAQKAKEGWQRTVVWGVLVVMPIALTPTMLGGFGGQLQPRQYPVQWYEANELLKQEMDKGEKVLILPWHQYSEYHFTQRIVANPAEVFFEVPAVASDDPEFKRLPPTTPNSDKRDIARALQDRSLLVDVLARQNIRYVVLMKEQDFDEYRYLDNVANLKKVQDNNVLSIYKREEK